MGKTKNLYYIGFAGKNPSFRPVEAETLSEAKTKFADFHKVRRSDDIVASRDYGEMTKRYKNLIK